MKYSKVIVLVLPNNSLLINVPLINREMVLFKRELSNLVRERGEFISTIKKGNISFFDILTELGRDEIESISNQIIKKVSKRRNRCSKGYSVKRKLLSQTWLKS